MGYSVVVCYVCARGIGFSGVLVDGYVRIVCMVWWRTA